MNDPDLKWMALAIEQADKAGDMGEIPVGCVIVRHGELLASGHNLPKTSHDPTAHAEIVALRAAARAVHNYRLNECDLYVTLEPCVMCAGAIVHARIRRVIFAAWDSKTGACGSVFDLLESSRHNHEVHVRDGVLADESEKRLKAFFDQARR